MGEVLESLELWCWERRGRPGPTCYLGKRAGDDAEVNETASKGSEEGRVRGAVGIEDGAGGEDDLGRVSRWEGYVVVVEGEPCTSVNCRR